MNIPIGKIATILGILSILAGAGLWTYNYHAQLVTRSEKALSDLDVKIAGTEVLVTLYELHGISKLSDEQDAKYNRANMRLIALLTHRDTITGKKDD